MMKYYKFEGVIAPNSGAGPQLNIRTAGIDTTVLPIVDPTSTFTAGYWYQTTDDAEILGGHQAHSGTNFEPNVFVEHPVADVPYPLDDEGTTQE